MSAAEVGARYRDRTRQDVESERHMDKVRPRSGREGALGYVTSESRDRVPALAPHRYHSGTALNERMYGISSKILKLISLTVFLAIIRS